MTVFDIYAVELQYVCLIAPKSARAGRMKLMVILKAGRYEIQDLLCGCRAFAEALQDEVMTMNCCAY
jgi:hypothetical protein